MQGQSPYIAGVREGELLAGKYRVDRVLGVGGMGVVVAAHHVQLDERCALKFLLPEALGNPQAVARFVREARAAVKIKSEHVARVTDVGTLENGAPYMVMEYLDGRDLGAWIEERGPLPVAQAVEFVLQACVAVADAHALEIVHRDLKPANLFCVRRSDGQLSIKVLDFGISKMNDLTGSTGGMTKTTAVLGSPLYMSPEQMRSSKTVDSRTDIWALGVVLFELISARAPFVADSLMELGAKIAIEPSPSLRQLRGDVPEGLDAVIARCLEKAPDRRYPNVAELASALLPFAPASSRSLVDRISGILRSSGRMSVPDPIASSGVAASTAERTNVPTGTLAAVGRTAAGATGDPPAVFRVKVAGLVVAAAGAVLLVFFLMRGLHREAPTSVASDGPSEEPAPVKTSPNPVTPSPVPSVRISRAAAVASSGPTPASPPTPEPSAASDLAPAPPSADTSTKRQTAPKAAVVSSAGPAATPATQARPHAAAPGSTPSCTVVTDYDGDGQPHFKKVCK